MQIPKVAMEFMGRLGALARDRACMRTQYRHANELGRTCRRQRLLPGPVHMPAPSMGVHMAWPHMYSWHAHMIYHIGIGAYVQARMHMATAQCRASLRIQALCMIGPWARIQ